MSDVKTLDLRGLACPQPVIRTKQALEGATSPFVVTVDDEGSATNVTRFAESQGAAVVVSRRGDGIHLAISPGAGGGVSEPPPTTCAAANSRDIVVLVSSEGMGRGDEQLGAVLMAAFLDTLGHLAPQISHAVFVNGGAKLTVEGSPVLEQITHLQEVGVDVLTCGTCLNHFGIKDRLAVGSVSNMLVIVETLSRAGRVLSP